MMASRSRFENLYKLVRKGAADWIPFTLDVGSIPGFTAPARERFQRETGQDRPEEYFDYDFRTASLRARFSGEDPAALHDHVEPGTKFDEWGIGQWAGGAAGTCEKAYPPLARAENVADVERIPTPIIEPGETAATVRAYQERGYPVFGYGGSVYEWAWWLRGMEQFLVDLRAEPALAETVIHRSPATPSRSRSKRPAREWTCFAFMTMRGGRRACRFRPPPGGGSSSRAGGKFSPRCVPRTPTLPVPAQLRKD